MEIQLTKQEIATLEGQLAEMKIKGLSYLSNHSPKAKQFYNDYRENVKTTYFDTFAKMGVPASMAVKDTPENRVKIDSDINALLKKWEGFNIAFIGKAVNWYVRECRENFRTWNINIFFEAVEKYHSTPKEKPAEYNANQIGEGQDLQEKKKGLLKRMQEIRTTLTHSEAWEIYKMWYFADTAGRIKERGKTSFMGMAFWLYDQSAKDPEIMEDIEKQADRNYRNYLAVNTGLMEGPGERTTDALIVRFRKVTGNKPKDRRKFLKESTLAVGGKYVFADQILEI